MSDIEKSIIREAQRFIRNNKGLKIDKRIKTASSYQSPRISSEFMDCSTPMTFDHYSFCSLGCQYCFALMSKSVNPSFSTKLHSVDYKAFIAAIRGEPTKQRYRKIQSHFLSKRFILHWGGLADPFCNFEKANGIGYKIVSALAEEKYPTLFSFKGSAIFRPNFSKLFSKYAHQKNFAFQVSIVAPSDQMSRKIEVGAPVTSRRLKALKHLSEMGYYCLDGKTEVFHKVDNSPYIRKASLQTIYKTGNNILVNCNGQWKKAKPIRVKYNRIWYKITLRNGAEIIQTDTHKNLTDVGRKKGRNLKIGDRLLVSNKPMNWDCNRGSYDLGRFVGLWVAEGCYVGYKHGFKFSFGTHEKEYIFFVKTFIEKLGGHAAIGTLENNGTDINSHSSHIKGLLNYFINRGRKCDTITLNRICYSMSKEFRQGLFAGWNEGDGNNGGQIFSTSEQLIKDMFILSNTIGIKCSISHKNKLQICDTLTKNSEVYRFNPNTSPFSRKMYCKITKIEKFKNLRKEFAYCLEVPDGHIFELSNGIITHNCILRLRPFIIGITDDGLGELLDRAKEAGIQAISMEYMAIDWRSSNSLQKRYKWIGELIGTKDFMAYFKALSPSERGGYMRLNRLVKESSLKQVYKFCVDNDILFGCSDPDGKELNFSGSCCALPDSYPENREMQNWSKSQLTYHLKEARRRYHLDGKIEKFKFHKVFDHTKDTFLNDPFFANDHICSSIKCASERHTLTYLSIARDIWNNLKSPANPMNYFHGRVLPFRIDENENYVFKYCPGAYEARWEKEGIDLTR